MIEWVAMNTMTNGYSGWVHLFSSNHYFILISSSGLNISWSYAHFLCSSQ